MSEHSRDMDEPLSLGASEPDPFREPDFSDLPPAGGLGVGALDGVVEPSETGFKLKLFPPPEATVPPQHMPPSPDDIRRAVEKFKQSNTERGE